MVNYSLKTGVKLVNYWQKEGLINSRAYIKDTKIRFYEAKGSNTTISIMINEDESLNISYTGHGRANGVFTVKED